MEREKVKYPGIPLITNGNQLVAWYTEALVAEAGVFFPITPSTQMGEFFQQSFAQGQLNVFGEPKIAIETEGEHAAQGGAIAASLAGKRVVNFTSGQGLVYGCEQYYHAPGKLSTMVLEVASRALTKSALNVHCGHDDIYAVMDTGWTILIAKDAQQAADQALILRKVNELSLTPGINVQDGFLTSHLERTFLRPEPGLIREFLGRPEDMITCPTEAQKALFGNRRRRVPILFDLKNPILLGPVQNQEHYMNGVIARRNNFIEPIPAMLEQAYKKFAQLTGRYYGPISEYNTENSDTIFVALGSAVENIEAAIDYLQTTRGENAGAIHINVLRPFPEAAIVKALTGKKRVIILERTDEPMAGGNPLTREIQTALAKAVENYQSGSWSAIPPIAPEALPRIFSGSYGLGSRDFRPEGILGAYEYARGEIKRQDGKSVFDGENFFYVGVNHPYNVCSEERPSLLPEHAIAVRFHSIGGWGAMKTGKNLGKIVGKISERITVEQNLDREFFHISANPKYGSEKKGAPTNYFLVIAPERIRVNCDLHHVNTVLCCDPKAFIHSNPLYGLVEVGALILESSENEPEKVWERIPKRYRQEILDKKIRLFSLQGFRIAASKTDREDLQLRMQGTAFLGAFFKVSEALHEAHITAETLFEIIEELFHEEFGALGENVVSSNINVMRSGFEGVREIPPGAIDAPDRSSFSTEPIKPMEQPETDKEEEEENEEMERAPIYSDALYREEFKGDYGYHQPASPLASTGIMAPATGATVSKYVARRQVPVWIAENCTQCMACVEVCPDTALPNTAQDISTIIKTAFESYVTDETIRKLFLNNQIELETSIREIMLDETAIKDRPRVSFRAIFIEELSLIVAEFSRKNKKIIKAIDKLDELLKHSPFAYGKARTIFEMNEKKKTGSGGVFSIVVNDRCKGCGECSVACGDHEALIMKEETEEIHGNHLTASLFLDRLPETPDKYLGKFQPNHPEESSAAILKNHLMIRRNYEAMVSGDGACAGCGEKSILRAITTITEAYMRPLFHAKADRVRKKAELLEASGKEWIEKLRKKDPESYNWWSKTVKHLFLGLGRESEERSLEEIEGKFTGEEEDLPVVLAMTLKMEAYYCSELRAVEGRDAHGMCVMAMTASTGCNTVYGSTHPNNPHAYPWLNSLFQDGVTIGWLLGETMIVDHGRRSVIPERLVDYLKEPDCKFTREDYFNFTHFTDALMTDSEIAEMPKIWAVAGDGGMGDIGFQNLSKALLQNRPNLRVLMLDTQVYSNTGGQNSDSSVMPGGFDMNQYGDATEGKLTERKEVAIAMMSGHGSPFVAQVSMANSAALYGALMKSLLYRGSAFIQSYTACQPEHGVGDDKAATQAKLARDSRCMPEFVFNPDLGESYQETLSLKGNPDLKHDWWQKTVPGTKEKYNYTVAHWAVTEARFRNHFFEVSDEDVAEMAHLNEILTWVTQKDVVHRNYLNHNHSAYIPRRGVYILIENGETMKPIGISRQMALFVIERRKNWRMLQSRAGIENEDYQKQKEYLHEIGKVL